MQRWRPPPSACRLKCHRISLPAALQLSKGFCHLSLPEGGGEEDGRAGADGKKRQAKWEGQRERERRNE